MVVEMKEMEVARVWLLVKRKWKKEMKCKGKTFIGFWICEGGANN